VHGLSRSPCRSASGLSRPAVGVVAVRRIDTAAERGHGLAVAVIILGAVGVVVTVIAIVMLAIAFRECLAARRR